MTGVNVVFYVIFGILGILGIVYLSGKIAMWFLKPSRVYETVTMIPVKGEMNDLERIVRFVESCSLWDYYPQNSRLILLDMGVDEETKRLCQVLSEKYENVAFCTRQEVTEYF